MLATVALLATVIIISAFVNNTPVALVLMPVALRMAAATAYPAPWLLMTLSYLAILGGACTMIGTSTNLLVDGLAQNAGLVPFDLFEITPIGLVAATTGTFTLALLLPLVRREPASPLHLVETTEPPPRRAKAPVADGGHGRRRPVGGDVGRPGHGAGADRRGRRTADALPRCAKPGRASTATCWC